MQKNKVILVDLDGTLLPYNSFPRWILFIFYHSIKSGMLSLALRVFTLFLQRKLFGSSHIGFKYNLMCLHYPSDWDHKFATKINVDFNQSVIELIEDLSYKFDCKAILTSAAPSCYLNCLSLPEHIFLNEKIGSVIQHDRLLENIGVNKRITVETKLKLKAVALITDHHDDFGAIDEGMYLYLVNPSKSTLNAVERMKIKVNKILEL
jgi:hypothetical protein